jgi:hypothetical protein
MRLAGACAAAARQLLLSPKRSALLLEAACGGEAGASAPQPMGFQHCMTMSTACQGAQCFFVPACLIIIGGTVSNVCAAGLLAEVCPEGVAAVQDALVSAACEDDAGGAGLRAARLCG